MATNECAQYPTDSFCQWPHVLTKAEAPGPNNPVTSQDAHLQVPDAYEFGVKLQPGLGKGNTHPTAGLFPSVGISLDVQLLRESAVILDVCSLRVTTRSS